MDRTEGPVYASLALSVGAPVRTARAVGAGQTLHEIGGVLFGTQAVVGVAW